MTRRSSVLWSGTRQFYFGAILAGGCWLTGCAKVEEMAKTATETAKETVASQTSKSNAPKESAPAAMPEAAAKADSAHILREFQALPGSEIRDEHLTRLASMDAPHREQVVQLNLDGSSVSGAGIGALAAFPNLAELSLKGNTAFSEADLSPLKELKNLRSLSLAFSSGDDSTAALLVGLPHLERLVLTAVPITDEGLKSIARISSLQYLDVSQNTSLSGPAMALLAGLPALQGLAVNSNQNMGEQGLLEIAKCKGLTELDVSHCGLSDQHFSILKAWPKLRSLKCNNNALTDQGMLFLKPLNELVELDLRNTRVTDQGFSQVGSRKLERLWISGISDQGMTHVKRFPALRELYLAETGISDQGVVQLKGLRNLEVLDLSATTISDRGLSQLVGLKSLRRIHLVKTGVSEAGVEGIAKAIPGLVVVDRAVQ